MTTPTDRSVHAHNTSDLDRMGEMLEQYVVTTAGNRAQGDASEPDPHLRAFIEASPRLIRVTEALRASWQSDLTVRSMEIPSVADVQPGTTGYDNRYPPQGRRGRLGMGTLPWGVFKPQPLRGNLWSAAVALALGLVVLVVGWTAGARHNSQRVAQASLAYTTGNGERATITLPDGGTVALNVASRLEVPMDYLAGNHTVRLVGEGLFTVPHQTGTPLTVLAGATAARVLGTSFVVRRYTTDTATLVAVREGKVAVGPAVVTAAHMVEVARTGVPRVQPSDASAFTFAAGVLTLNHIPLSVAIAELDRWYDADIRLGSPTVGKQQLTGEFKAGSLADLVEDLQFTLGVRVVRDGRVLTLFTTQ